MVGERRLVGWEWLENVWKMDENELKKYTEKIEAFMAEAAGAESASESNGETRTVQVVP